MARVAIVGGGISGLAAAWFLTRADAGIDAVVYEGSSRAGGKLRREVIGGLTLDVGAESILARRPEALDLIAEVGLGDRLTHPEPVGAGIWKDGSPTPIPPSVMGIPLVDSEADLALGPVPPGDVSIGNLVAARFGEEAVEDLVEPLLGGVYAGRARELSFHATVPNVATAAAEAPNLAAAARASIRSADGPVFAGLDGGVAQLAETLASQLSVNTDAMVTSLTAARGGFGLGGVDETCDAVVLAAPAPPAARLLAEVVPAAADALAEIEYASVAIITFVVPRAQVPPDSSGFLVPPRSAHLIKAVTWSSSKWAWVGTGDLAALRCSVGRYGSAEDLHRTDAELTTAVLADLAALGYRIDPEATHVQRWGGGLPQYAVGHRDRVAAVRAEVARVPGLAVCGAAYDGLGIPACIASACRAADEVLATLT